jgi:RNA polymerase-binding transcription factor DksA
MEQRTKPKQAVRPRADTDEILGSAAADEKVPEKWKAQFRRLIDLRNYLGRSKGSLVERAREDSPNFSQHMADAGTDEYERDMALSRISSEQDALYEIEHALQRIQDGTYGICEITGKPIEPERLKAIPWTRFSAQAEKELEQRGQVSTAKLGDVEKIPKASTANQVGENME